VAILHDPRTFIQAHGEQDVGLYAASVRGCYRAFWRANIPVDIIVPQQLMTLDPGRYKAIYLPFAYMLSRDEGARLARYVENGGALFAGTWCGLKDERTFLYETVPGTGLDQVFYCREIQTNPAGQSPLTIIKAHLALPSLPVGTELPVHRYRQLLEPLPGAEIVAEFNDKTPAIIMGRHGKGITLYAGTMLCHAYDGTSNAAIAGLILDFARSSGVHEPILIHKEPSNSLVEARVLSDGKAHKLIVLLNHGSAEATITATTTDNPSSTIRNLITGETLKTAADPNGIKMNLIIPAQDVRVLSVE